MRCVKIEKYYKIATEVAKGASVAIEDIISTISKAVSVLIGFGYSRDEIDKIVTVEYIESVVMENTINKDNKY